MYTSAVLASAFAAVSLAAPAPIAQAASTTPLPPLPPKSALFHIKATPRDPAACPEFDQFLTSFHVGAGQSTIVGTPDQSKASQWYITEGSVLADYVGRSDIPPFTLGLADIEPALSDAPQGYKYISLNLGLAGDRGFLSIPNPDGNQQGQQIVFEGKSPAVQSFALCHVNGTSPYLSLGPQYQLLWEPSQTERAPLSQCADVALSVVKA